MKLSNETSFESRSYMKSKPPNTNEIARPQFASK